MRDFASADERDSWLRDPVLGDPSFDSFSRAPGNPLIVGKAPYEWPVNAFLYREAETASLYAYIGQYAVGYYGRGSRCSLFRSKDEGVTWESLGVVLEGDAKSFDGDGVNPGHTPEISIVREDGRYHAIYDWGTDDGKESGLAYAWADRPEGPFHRAPSAVHQRSLQPLLDGRYQRPYAGTLIRRANDWLIVADIDEAPLAWALYAMSAPRPDGPYSPAVIVRQVDRDYFHPPLMEHFPAFSHGGFVYAPATSVALNRNFNMIFRAPLERATEPDAWEVWQHGSVWHAEDVASEAYGIWGQTIAGAVGDDGQLRVLFPCRDADGIGAVGLAIRPWDRPYTASGFRLTAHRGPSMTLLSASYGDFRLSWEFVLRGTVRLVWDYSAPVGPDRAASDATLHPLVWTRHKGLELSDGAWRLLECDEGGIADIPGRGTRATPNRCLVDFERRLDQPSTLSIDGEEVWTGMCTPGSGPLGLLLEPNSSVSVDRFEIEGDWEPAVWTYIHTEALLGAGESVLAFEERADDAFRFGSGRSGRGATNRLKWNFSGTGFALWNPRGPEWGTATVLLDGEEIGELDFRAEHLEPSGVSIRRDDLAPGFHALVLVASSLRFPVDSLDTWTEVTGRS